MGKKFQTRRKPSWIAQYKKNFFEKERYLLVDYQSCNYSYYLDDERMYVKHIIPTIIDSTKFKCKV